MTFVFRKDIQVPEKLILGLNSNAFLLYENSGITFYVNSVAQMIVDATGGTITNDTLVNSVLLARSGTNPIQLVDATNSSIGLLEGFLIDNSYTDDDFRLFLPNINADDQVIFNPGAGDDTALLKFKMNSTNGDNDGNFFTKFAIGNLIVDGVSDVFLGGIANNVGTIDICQPINATTIGTVNGVLNETAMANIVAALAPKELIWDGGGRNVTIEAFYGPEVALLYAAATFTSTEHGLMVCQAKLFPVLWAAVRYLLNFAGLSLTS